MTTAPFDRHHYRRAALVLAVALVIAPLPGISRAGWRATPVCEAHLAKADRAFAALAGQDAGLLDCAALHGQVRAMLEIRNIYMRCTTGPMRTERVGQADASLDQATARLDSVCPIAQASN
ncbi:hypothetical protein EDC22_101522 [Tepidamorphus gemmatus]|jgi:hypothetical protein|uniref:Uncharacterized protein n=1 Tax=Tepidamorphus gemmatus TaxID=747076 RepID=A0A4R3MJ38_9HYPH|nr:hypothetical protein [Tepidamorphus gemmatus]TCT13652.1 hypothetical protein EDC22_101522 [Tepidamorphus gemmatus]